MKRLAQILVVAGLMVGCGGSEAKYNTVQRGPIHSEMWRLMELTTELDTLMRESEPGPVPQAQAVALLAGIENAAATLAARRHRHKHPMLEDNAATFLQLARQARKAAQGDPPNYYYAGIVSGSCVLCHDPNGGIR